MSQQTDYPLYKIKRTVSHPEDRILSERVYNLILGSVICYGILINVLLLQYIAPDFMPVAGKINIIILLLAYVLFCAAGCFIARRSSSPVVSFIGYNMVILPVGSLVAIMMEELDSDVTYHILLITGIVTIVMLLAIILYSALFKNFKRMLGVTSAGILAAYLICRFIMDISPEEVSWIIAVIFSLYIGNDWIKAQSYVKTPDNAVDSAVDIYVDLFELFLPVIQMADKNTEEKPSDKKNFSSAGAFHIGSLPMYRKCRTFTPEDFKEAGHAFRGFRNIRIPFSPACRSCALRRNRLHDVRRCRSGQAGDFRQAVPSLLRQNLRTPGDKQ